MAIQSVKTTINGTEYTLTYNSSTGMYEANIQAPAASSFSLSGGYYPVSVTATDTAGNVTTVNHTDSTLGENLRLYVKEQVKPTIQITSPSSGAYVTTGRPTITFKLLDNSNGQTTGFSGIKTSTCVVKVNGTTISGAEFTPIMGGYTGTITPSTTIPDGSCTVTVDVADNDGNSATTASCTFTVDTVAPSLTVTSPVNNFETNQPSVTVSGVTDDTTSKPITVHILLDNVDQGNVTVGTDGSFTKTVTLSSEGTHSIVVTATDYAGKETTVTRTVKYDSSAPVIESVTITPNPVYAGNTYTISVKVV